MSKRTLEDSAEAEEQSTSGKRSRQELLTFKNRDGQVESTHTWSDIDSLVALRTMPQDASIKHDSVLLASRSILCRDSMVFKDILTIPAPENPKDEDVWEGHPVIVVQDYPCDLQDFLEALHDWRSYIDSPKSKEVFHICALLRMGTKYQVGFLREKMIAELSARIPTSVADFQKLLLATTPTTFRDYSMILASLEETDYPLLLPGATFIVARQTLRSELSSIPIRTPGSTTKTDESASACRWFSTEASRFRVAAAHLAITQLYFITLIDLLSQRSPTCQHRSKCHQALRNWRDNWAGHDQPGFLTDQFPCCFARATYEHSAVGLCDACCTKVGKKLDGALSAAWDRLPLLLNMESWGTLRERSYSSIPATVS